MPGGVGSGGLDDHLLTSGGQPVRAMVVTTWRSGSTFLGMLPPIPPPPAPHLNPSHTVPVPVFIFSKF